MRKFHKAVVLRNRKVQVENFGTHSVIAKTYLRLLLDIVPAMDKRNDEWHRSYRMPKNPSIDERIQWHLAHKKNCSCRPIPQKLLEEMKKRRRAGVL